MEWLYFTSSRWRRAQWHIGANFYRVIHIKPTVFMIELWSQNLAHWLSLTHARMFLNVSCQNLKSLVSTLYYAQNFQVIVMILLIIMTYVNLYKYGSWCLFILIWEDVSTAFSLDCVLRIWYSKLWYLNNFGIWFQQLLTTPMSTMCNTRVITTLVRKPTLWIKWTLRPWKKQKR